jgi:membrane fusion protein, multidrug efflux system
MATEVEPNPPADAKADTELQWRAWEDLPPGIVVDDPQRERRNWTAIAIGLVGLLSVTAIILSLFALAASNSGPKATAGTVAATAGAGALGNTAAPLSKPETINVAVKADDEHGKLGPDGKWHDAFLPASFTVHPGDKVTVTVKNYDGGPHSFTSPSLGLNAMISAGSMKHPHQTTFTFTAPKHPGRYAWWCAMPCDPWAMSHVGYMRGYVTVKA